MTIKTWQERRDEAPTTNFNTQFMQDEIHELRAQVAELGLELATAKLAAKYAEHSDATPENQWQTMLHDALTERNLLKAELADFYSILAAAKERK